MYGADRNYSTTGHIYLTQPYIITYFSSSSSSQSSGESDTERQNTKKTVKKAMNIETLQELEKIRLDKS